MGDAQSPVLGVFADKSGNALYADASGPGMVSSDNWMGTGRKGGGFNVQIGRGTPDARTFPFVHLRWGLYVGVKGNDLAPLGKPQPIIRQMDMLGGVVLQRVLLQYAFDQLRAPRVAATTLEANTASIRVMEKLGLRWERDWLYKEENPAVLYSITAKRDDRARGSRT